jgi:hypothetical protein
MDDILTTYGYVIEGETRRLPTAEEIERFNKDREDYRIFEIKQAINFNRSKRNNLLFQSDWIELPSAASRLSQAQIDSWLTYRQELRDITTQSGFPENVVWPTAPV